jgi:hypothetical protein
MKLLFVHHVIEDRGSAQDMFHYVRVAEQLGHQIALYGPCPAGSPFRYSQDVDRADAVIFIFEWTTQLQNADALDLARLVERFPRERRVVIDCDGNYNDAISVAGDVNHPDVVSSRRWVAVCDSLSDKIYQPTWHPLCANVRPFFFHAYEPSWEQPLDFVSKPYGMVYVGNNWFRWRSLERLLKSIEKIRDRVGPLALVGNGWGQRAPWANSTLPEDAYRTDPVLLERLKVETVSPVRFDRVIEWMGRGVFNPVIYRPLFDRLQLVTCRTYETPAANTIPLFCQDEQFVRGTYGTAGLELVLPAEQPEEKIVDLLARPKHYEGVVLEIRNHLATHYSYEARVKELIDIVEN